MGNNLINVRTEVEYSEKIVAVFINDVLSGRILTEFKNNQTSVNVTAVKESVLQGFYPSEVTIGQFIGEQEEEKMVDIIHQYHIKKGQEINLLEEELEGLQTLLEISIGVPEIARRSIVNRMVVVEKELNRLKWLLDLKGGKVNE